MYPHILTNTVLTIVIDDKQYSINNDHPNFQKIVKKIKTNNQKKILELISVKNQIIGQSFGDIIIGDNDILYYKDIELHTYVADRIVQMFREGFDISNMLKFLENVMLNPLDSAINELYDFLEYGKLPITDDGHFLAYKKVNNDFTDIRTGTFDNSPGSIVSMDRGDVNANRHDTCSAGLHFCSKEYLGYYSSSDDDKIVILKINPKDVVSIPTDYNKTKGRACQYEVISEYDPNIDDTQLTKTVANNDIIQMTVKQKIVFTYIKNFIESQYGYDMDSWDFSTYRKYFKDDYSEIINHIMNDLFDKNIARDTAVRYFKFIKDNFGLK